MKSFKDLLNEDAAPQVFDWRENKEAKTVDIGFKNVQNTKETTWITFDAANLKKLADTVKQASEVAFKSNQANKDNNLK
jgi:hypothetical protein